MTPDESQLTDDLRAQLMSAKIELLNERTRVESLASRSGELERAANLVACQATELCRILRGGGMEHKRTEP